MGSLSDSMQAVVDEITASAQLRHARVRELAGETTGALRRLGSERHQTAQSLAGRFATDRAQRTTQQQARLEATRRLMGQICTLTGQRRATVSALRCDAGKLVGGVGSERRKMAQDLREKLSSETSSLRESVRQVKESIRGQMGELSSDVQGAYQVWRDQKTSKRRAKPAVRKKPTAQAARRVAGKPKAETLADPKRVLNLVAKRPQGIRLVDMGRALGVDWRRLIAPAKALADHGEVEKIRKVYYPKGAGN